MRKAETTRKTKETEISLMIDLDGRGECAVGCPEPFLGHMLDAFCRFSLIDLSGSISGDLSVDPHHTVEDSGFVLGTVLREALGSMVGAMRAGSAYIPMDEALARAVIDFSGRPFCLVAGCETAGNAGAFTRELFEEFWQGFCRGARATMHIDLIRGKNGHHAYEAGFKAAGRAVMAAVALSARAAGILPSTKGSLDGYPGSTPQRASFAPPPAEASAGNAASGYAGRNAIPEGNGA